MSDFESWGHSLICFKEENGSQSASVFSCATGLGAWRKRDDER